MAAMEQAWGKEKARDYLARLAKQDLIFRRGTTLTSQLVAAGEQPIGVTINAETTADMRDKGAPLGFSVLPPRAIKPEWVFRREKSAAPARGFVVHRLVVVGRRTKSSSRGFGQRRRNEGHPVQVQRVPGRARLRRRPRVRQPVETTYDGVSEDFWDVELLETWCRFATVNECFKNARISFWLQMNKSARPARRRLQS